MAAALDWWQYGWLGRVLAFSAVLFWLLLQLGRALTVMKIAGQELVTISAAR